MTKIDIISGFLGAGKTTLIKKLLETAYKGEKVVLIENEFGEIGIDGGFLKDAGIEITEMNSGCICCSLVGDFGEALKKVLEQFAPDRIIIEPSGVGKLSDVIRAVQGIEGDLEGAELNSFSAVVDATKAKVYMKNFGEFFNNQVESAKTIVLSRTQKMTDEKLMEVVGLLREHNANATIITTPWDALDADTVKAAMEKKESFADEMLHEFKEHHHDEDECDDPDCECHHHHHHHDDDDDEECCCGHHHHDHDDDDDDDDEECCCGHHHHHDDDDDDDHEHEHHHHHHHDHDEDECDDPECECHHHHDHDHEHEHEHEHDHEHEHHHHHHHHHHHADEVFTSWGKETPKKYDKAALEEILKKLSETEEYGKILRAKGMVNGVDGQWIYFDLVPGEYELRNGQPDYTGKLCVIGAELKEEAIEQLFA